MSCGGAIINQRQYALLFFAIQLILAQIGGTVLLPADDTSGRAGTSALQCRYGDRRRVAGHVPTRLAATPGGPAHEERSSPARRPRPIQRTVGGAGAFAMVP